MQNTQSAMLHRNAPILYQDFSEFFHGCVESRTSKGYYREWSSDSKSLSLTRKLPSSIVSRRTVSLVVPTGLPLRPLWLLENILRILSPFLIPKEASRNFAPPICVRCVGEGDAPGEVEFVVLHLLRLLFFHESLDLSNEGAEVRAGVGVSSHGCYYNR